MGRTRAIVEWVIDLAGLWGLLTGGLALTVSAYVTGLLTQVQTFPAWLEFLVLLGVAGIVVAVGLLFSRFARRYMYRGREGRVFRGKRVRATDLIGDGGQPLIRGLTFIDCVIDGPAVLFMKDDAGNVVTDPHINSPYEAIKWQVAVTPELPVVGAIVCQRCVFQGCTFDRIAFLGGEAVGAVLREGTRTVGSPT